MRGRVSIYEPRGDYQLIVDHLEPAGEGLLRRRLEELKRKLAAEGLFDEVAQAGPAAPAPSDRRHHVTHRRRHPGRAAHPAPALPGHSGRGYPVQVQGEQAKFDIVAGAGDCRRAGRVRRAHSRPGRRLLEDLWAFNEEIVARAIAACPIPLVAGIGHEVDFTIADLVADVRAPTPSGAAELVVPDGRDWLRTGPGAGAPPGAGSPAPAGRQPAGLRAVTARLARCHPGFMLRQNAQRLDELRGQLGTALRNRLGPRSPAGAQAPWLACVGLAGSAACA